jgi:DNA-binding transcriptional ArsR family regulator
MTTAVAEDRLDATYAALGDRTRRRILARLANGEATVNELAAPFDMTLQAVSQHIRVLERAGLISRTRERQTRPCRLEPDALRVATEWIDQQQQLWTDRLDQLEQHLQHLQQDRRKP